MITREEAEKIVRKVIQSHAGESLAPNLFKDSVDELMREANADVQTTIKEAEEEG